MHNRDNENCATSHQCDEGENSWKNGDSGFVGTSYEISSEQKFGGYRWR